MFIAETDKKKMLFEYCIDRLNKDFKRNTVTFIMTFKNIKLFLNIDKAKN